MNTDDLEILFAKVIEKLRAAEYAPEMLQEFDEYWHVNAPGCFDFSKLPELAVGSLYDDASELSKAVESDVLLPYVDFDRVAALLIAISDRLSR